MRTIFRQVTFFLSLDVIAKHLPAIARSEGVLQAWKQHDIDGMVLKNMMSSKNMEKLFLFQIAYAGFFK